VGAVLADAYSRAGCGVGDHSGRHAADPPGSTGVARMSQRAFSARANERAGWRYAGNAFGSAGGMRIARPGGSSGYAGAPPRIQGLQLQLIAAVKLKSGNHSHAGGGHGVGKKASRRSAITWHLASGVAILGATNPLRSARLEASSCRFYRSSQVVRSVRVLREPTSR